MQELPFDDSCSGASFDLRFYCRNQSVLFAQYSYRSVHCYCRYDFVLPNGKAGDIKIKKGKIHVSIGIPENPKSFKEVNLNDEKNFRLKNALQLLELSIKDIKITSEITADLEKAVAKIFLENYTSDNIEINESEKVDD